MDDGTVMLLIFLIGVILPCAILLLVAVGALLRFLWEIDDAGVLYRPLIKWGGCWLLMIISLLIFFMVIG